MTFSDYKSSQGVILNFTAGFYAYDIVALREILRRHVRTTRLPLEVAEMVIDMCSDRSTLLACALTCRAWLPRTRYNLLRIVDIHDRRQLACFAQFLTKNKTFDALVAEICIHLPPDDPRMLSLFPALLARKVTKCTRLHILRASSGPPLQIHPSTGFFVLLPEFSHITKPILTSVMFSSLTELTSLVLYIRGLLDLRCTDVR